MKKSKKSAGKLNLLLLISTMTTAVLTGLGMQFFHTTAYYTERDNRLYMPLVMAAMLAVFLTVTSLVVYLISNIKLTYRADVITGRNSKGRIFLYVLCGIILIGLFMFGAEFLYERNLRFHSKDTGADTYMFLIDDSYSMRYSDPDAERYSVIENMLRDKHAKTQFAVYSFSDEVKLRVPMRTVGEGFPTYSDPDHSLTYMKMGLEQVINDCEQGIWTPKGETTLIVITDGSPSDFASIEQVTPILDKYVSREITIGIVGVLGANNTLMTEVAAYTGGTFTNIDDATLMDEAVRAVSGSAGRTRDLLSIRDAVEMEWLYAVIRILAFVVAGSLMAVAAAMAYGNNTAFAFIVWANVIKAVMAGVLMEIAFQTDFAGILQLVAWILMGTILARNSFVEEHEIKGGDSFDFFDGPVNKNGHSYRR